MAIKETGVDVDIEETIPFLPGEDIVDASNVSFVVLLTLRTDMFLTETDVDPVFHCLKSMIAVHPCTNDTR